MYLFFQRFTISWLILALSVLSTLALSDLITNCHNKELSGICQYSRALVPLLREKRQQKYFYPTPKVPFEETTPSYRTTTPRPYK